MEPPAAVQAWLAPQLRALLQLDRTEDAAALASATVALSSKEEIEDQLYGLLGDGAEAQKLVVELLKRLGKWVEPERVPEKKPLTLSQEGITVYIKDKDDDMDMYRVKGKNNKSQKKKEDKYELALPEQNKPYRVEQTVFVYKKKKKAKGGANGEDSGPAERSRCGCQARLHTLVNNCVRCGRIVCSKEGAGPCFHCQAMVYAVSGEVAENVAAVAALESGASQRELAGLQKAQEHLGRLLDFDQNAVRRTTVYDDQADYFDMSQWLSEEERKVLKDKEEAIIREKEARKNMITIDFAGRKVVTEEAEALKFEEEVMKQIAAGAHVPQKKAADSLLFNPSAVASTGVRPTFIEAPTPVSSSSTSEAKQKKKRKLTDDDDETQAQPTTSEKAQQEKPGRNYARAVAPDAGKNRSSRVQHEFYPETDVQISTLDFDQLVLDDKTPLDKASQPLERRGIVLNRPFRSLEDAKSVVGWLSSKKANSLVVLHSFDPHVGQDTLPIAQLNAECRAAALKLSLGVTIPLDFEYGSEEAVAKLRSQIHDLVHNQGVSEFVFFFSGDLDPPTGFRSLAQAQISLVNSTIKFFERYNATASTPVQISWMIAPSRPFSAFDNNDTPTLLYLRELDRQVHQDVTFLWNGPHKLSRKISLDYLKKQKGFFKRKTVLWERAPATGSRIHAGSVLAPYAGRPAELGCFSVGLLLSVEEVGDQSWRPFVGSALTFSQQPTEYSALRTFKDEIGAQFSGTSDAASAAVELVDTAPASFLRERVAPPSCLRLGSKDEVAYFRRQRVLSETILKHPSGAWGRTAEYLGAFSHANELFASFEATGRKIDHEARVALTQALRKWLRLIEPAAAAVKSLKTSLFKHQIPDKSFVQEVQSNYFKWEQQTAMVKSQRSSRVPRAALSADMKTSSRQKIKELEALLMEDLYDLECFLIDAYNDADLQAIRDYVNMYHFDAANKVFARPQLSSPMARQLDRVALDRFTSRLQHRRAEAAKKLAAAAAATSADVAPESDKCEEVKNLPVPGLRYFRNWVTSEEEADLLAQINTYPWSSALQRRTQQYGYVYDYGAVKSQDVGDSRLSMGPMMPSAIQRIADRLLREKITPARPDQCIINEYLPGQGINPHIDHVASFQDCIVSISLGSDAVMDFKNLKGDELKHVLLQRRSAVVLTGDSRYHWQHSIAAQDTDQINGKEIRRAKRISITFRKVTQQAIQAITKASKR